MRKVCGACQMRGWRAASGPAVAAVFPGSWEDAYRKVVAPIAQAAGADVTLIELRPEQEWRLDIDELRRAIRPNTKLILLNTPHNPT